MFLTITTTGTPAGPATDLGFLLHKHPDNAQQFATSHGIAQVFYPEATAERCTAALLLEVDPMRIEVPSLPARGGAELVRKLFEPLGWSSVTAEPVALDAEFPQWGDSRYVRLVLEGELRLADALRHLYVLLPVLDDARDALQDTWPVPVQVSATAA